MVESGEIERKRSNRVNVNIASSKKQDDYQTEKKIVMFPFVA